MRLFSRKKKNAELLAISLAVDGLFAANVRHELAALPALDFVCFYPKAKQEWEVLLERLGRETRAKKMSCSLLLNAGEYQLTSLESLNVPDDELKEAARFRLKEVLDYSVDEACYDLLKVPGDTNNAGRNSSLIAVVAKSANIVKHQNAFIKAKLPLDVIDVAEMAQRNISALLETPGRGLAMLSFDINGGILTVSFAGELYLSRRLDISSTDLRNPDVDERGHVFERVSLELQRSLDHFDRQHNYITTAKLVLSPIGAVAQDLKVFLSGNMYMPVEILDLASIVNLTKIPEMEEPEKQADFFYVIGAALRREVTAI
ncbi:MAG: agglutinin biogenesis protein MshI [Undibacterium sp.]|nr:agglutinin biogenesis protein MshI [Undibacterium sp.]